MKGILYSAFFLWAGFAQAYMISPTSLEVKFAYTAEFQTQQTSNVNELILLHSSYLFGYMQSPELAAQFDINKRTAGFGAPTWPPVIQVVSDVKAAKARTIKYHAEGVFLLNDLAARAMLKQGSWQMALPYDLDNYFNPNCVTPGEGTGKSEFWYFYDPYMPKCTNLVTSPLAQTVTMAIAPMPAADKGGETADLEAIRGDNGNGTLFQITTITGFDETEKKSDNGSVSFKDINDWLEKTEHFTKTVVQSYPSRPIYQFDKDVLDSKKGPVHIRLTRLLVQTDLDNNHVTFAKFLKSAIENADVILYAGHSGAGTMLEAEDIEAEAGPLIFSKDKKQLFFFDACSGYSYYTPLFVNRKAAGTLDLMTMGLTSQFGFEHAMHKAFLRYMFDMKNDHPVWNDMMTSMEKSLRGMSFMLNLQVM